MRGWFETGTDRQTYIDCWPFRLVQDVELDTGFVCGRRADKATSQRRTGAESDRWLRTTDFAAHAVERVNFSDERALADTWQSREVSEPGRVASVVRSESSASPPKLGLQLISAPAESFVNGLRSAESEIQASAPPIESSFWVSRRVLAPVRALAAAASHPACPPPMTSVSYGCMSAFEQSPGASVAKERRDGPFDLKGRGAAAATVAIDDAALVEPARGGIE